MWRVDRVRLARGPRVLLIAVGARFVEAGVRGDAAFECASRVALIAEDDELASLEAAVKGAISGLGEIAQADSAPLPCRVVVSDFWLRATELPWSTRLLGDDLSVGTHVRDQFEASGWDVADDDLIRWDHAGAHQPGLAVLYPARLLAAIRAAALAPRFVLTSIRPLSVVALGLLANRQSNALAIIEDEVSTFLPVHVNHLGEPVIELSLQPRAAVLASWRRYALLGNTSRSTAGLAVLDLSADCDETSWPSDVLRIAPPALITLAGPPAGSTLACLSAGYSRHALDAIQAPRRRRSIYVLTALSIVGAVLLAVQVWQSTAQLAALRAEMAPVVQVPLVSAPPLTRAEQAQWQRINEVTHELNAPIGVVMAALKSPADIDVQIVSADVDASVVGNSDAGRRITVQAESRQALDMQRYVDFLANRPKLASATLVRHDLSEGAAGTLYRFTVEATWRP